MDRGEETLEEMRFSRTSTASRCSIGATSTVPSLTRSVIFSNLERTLSNDDESLRMLLRVSFMLPTPWPEELMDDDTIVR